MDTQVQKRLAIFLIATGVVSVLGGRFISAEVLVLGIAIGIMGYCVWPEAPDREE